jgi:1,4-dihydroxy-2-naphthoyl-CoA hydrolase
VRCVSEPSEPLTADALNAISRRTLAGMLGVHVVEVERGRLRSRLAVRPEHLAANGYLHAGTVVALADTSCGYGCRASLPDGATGFTTIELKTNFLGTARDGVVTCEAAMVHGGRTTQVWDAVVGEEGSSRTIAMFRCTELLLYPAD